MNHSISPQVRSLQDSSWDSEAAAGGRQWTYQTCTEFGWYQSSDSPAETGWGRVIPVQLFERMCRDVFGPKFTPQLLARGIAATNAEYGGRDISVEKVVFVHGSIDPWHAMGIVQSDREAAPAIYIEGDQPHNRSLTTFYRRWLLSLQKAPPPFPLTHFKNL